MVVGLCGTARETVHDEVQSRLISQQRALQHNIEKLSRCVATNVKDANKLKDDRGVLEDDLGGVLQVDPELTLLAFNT